MGFIAEGVEGIFKAVTNGKGLGTFVTDTLDSAGVLKILTPAEKATVQAEADKIEAERLSSDNETIKLVNQSIQAEANSEHFLTYSWRPLVAYSFIVVLLINYAVCPILKIPAVVIPEQVFYVVGAVLGVSALYRGQMQVQDIKNQAGK